MPKKKKAATLLGGPYLQSANKGRKEESKRCRREGFWRSGRHSWKGRRVSERKGENVEGIYLLSVVQSFKTKKRKIWSEKKNEPTKRSPLQNGK